MTDAIAWALVHFLWQGTLLALVAAALLRVARSASVRYAIGVSTLAAMTLAVAVTVGRNLASQPTHNDTQRQTHNDTQRRPTPNDTERHLTTPNDTQRFTTTPNDTRSSFTMWLFVFWALGVSVLSTRVLGGWMVARRITRIDIAPLPAEVQRLVEALSSRLAIRRAVRVFESTRVAVPMMIGWLRPVVLMPASALAALAPAQLEAILAHEFAHIRRHDYLINLLQTAAETLLFFHPAVWWVSREVRRDRELCCDDEAVAVCDRLTYATALSALAHLQPPALALAATDGSLRDRVRRLVIPSHHQDSSKGGWMAMLPLVLVASLAAPSAFTLTQTATQAPPKKQPVVVDQKKTVAAPPKPVLVAVAPKVNKDLVIKVDRPGLPVLKADVDRKIEAVRQPNVDPLSQAQLVLNEQRLELERLRIKSQAELDREKAELEIATSRLALERTKELVEQGQATRSALAAAEQQVRLNELAMKQTQVEAELALQDLQIQERELELRAVAVRFEQERALEKELERELEILASKVGPQHPDRILLQERLRQQQAARLSVGRPLDSEVSLVAADVLTIRIEGESDLPTQFTVRSDGSIRFPLLGTIRVQGSTTNQVQTVLSKLLADKGITASVAVTATRR